MSTSYSYRTAPGIPDFDDSAPIAFMDGDCALCSFSARMIHRLDHSGTMRICPIQSPLGRAILHHYDMAPDDPASWIFLEDGIAHSDSTAIIRLGRRLGGRGHILRTLAILPRPVRDWLYARVARNRYAMFGKGNLCALPDPAFRARLIE